MKKVALESRKQVVEPNETALPVVHTVYVGEVVIVQTIDFAYALQCYLNRARNL